MRGLILLLFSFPFLSLTQEIEGKWVGSFIQYTHNTYDVELTVSKLSQGNNFSAQLRITNGYYFGEYQISGFICQLRNLEINTIILVKENESGGWVDCLNGTWDLNDDENELTFTDTWIDKNGKNNACKVKYLQKEMFQCLRSSYLRKVKYSYELAEFEKNWEDYILRVKPQQVSPTVPKPLAVAEQAILPIKSETKIVSKNEERAPIIDTFEEVKNRQVLVRDEIEVSSADITIEYWDRYTEDGDSIDIYLNKKPLVENVRLTKVKKIIQVHLEKTNNYLVVNALNLGTEPPNTASVTVKDGKKIQNVSLTSTLKSSGALKIIHKK